MPRKGTNGAVGDRKYRNITVDAEVHTLLVTAQDKLSSKLGFKPSLSQVVKHLVKEVAQ